MVVKGHTCRRPIEILEEDQIERIHWGILDVLEKTGVVIKHERALKIAEEGGCLVDYKKELVRFPRSRVEEALRNCRSSFTVKARDPKYDIEIGGSTVYFTSFVGMDAVDVYTGERKVPTKQDYIDNVRVCDALDEIHLHFTGGYCNLRDVPPAMINPWRKALMIKNSAKVSHGPSVAESEVWDIKMAKATDQQLIGALTSSPPLTFSGDFFSALLRYAEAEFPIFMTSGTMFGGSGPATLAGSLISYNAEMMAGLVLTQIVKPRLGFIAGNYSHPLNMKTGSPIAGGIERGIFQIAFDQIWRHYKVPCSFALSSDSKVPDYQCAYEKTMNAVLAALSGCNIIHMAGGVYDEITWSPVVAVIDNDILHMIGRVLEGIEVTDETLALDLIEEVGQIPGHFLNREHTRKWWKREQFIPDLADRLSYDDWVRRGSKEILTRAKQKVEEILTEHEPTSLPKDQAKEIDRILEEAREYYKKRSMI